MTFTDILDEFDRHVKARMNHCSIEGIHLTRDMLLPSYEQTGPWPLVKVKRATRKLRDYVGDKGGVI